MLLELALVRFAHRAASAARATSPSSRRCWSARRRSYGTGFLPGDRDQIYEVPKDELFLVGTSEVALAGAARRRDPRRRRAAAALRGLLDLLPPRGGRRRHATRAASSASTSSTRSRCSRSSSPPSRRPSTSGCWRSRSGSCSELEIPYRVRQRRRRRPRRPGGEEVRLRGLDPEPGALPRADLVLEHDRLPGAPPQLPVPACRWRSAQARAHAERDRGGRGPNDDRADREPAGAGRRLHATQYFACDTARLRGSAAQ